jgi:hypothetical protein
MKEDALKRNILLFCLSTINFIFFSRILYIYLLHGAPGLLILMPYMIMAINILFSIIMLCATFFYSKFRWYSCITVAPSIMVIALFLYVFSPILDMDLSW